MYDVTQVKIIKPAIISSDPGFKINKPAANTYDTPRLKNSYSRQQINVCRIQANISRAGINKFGPRLPNREPA